jgi:anti-sigma factor RsiW
MQVADFNQFGSAKPGQSGNPQHCAQCEAMLVDALDGTLSAAEQATFDLHMVGCSTCAAMLADAQRGSAWMEMLKSPRPEPSATLLERILAQTSGLASSNAQTGREAYPLILGSNDRLRAPEPPHTPNTLLGHPIPIRPSTIPVATFASSNVLPFRSRLTHGLRSFGQTILQPRLAMTAAMAFFSIALTMNLTGVHLSSLRASDLKPSSIMRSCYETKARVARYSDNLRVVYELESRVHDLQRSSDDGRSASSAPLQTEPDTQKPANAQPDQRPASQNPDQKQSRPKPGPGSSRREAPAGDLLLVRSMQNPGLLLPPAQAYVVFSPSVFKQEGGLV